MRSYTFPRINTPLPQEGWVAIILAGGKGTRMKSEKNKVCHTVGGIPVINRTIATLKNCGFPHILVVAGHRYWELIETVEEEFPDVNFVLQEEAKGTGDAVRCACKLLQDVGFNGNLLIIAGDKIVDAKNLLYMKEAFQRGNYDLLLASSWREGRSFGRIIRDENGQIKAIIESKGRENDFPPYGETNQSIYLVKALPLYEVIYDLSPDPYSAEEHFTDIVEMFYQRGKRMETFNVDEEKIMTFNTIEELGLIEEKVGKVHFLTEKKNLLGESNFKPVSQWLNLFDSGESGLLKALKDIYGDEKLVRKRMDNFRHLLKSFGERLGYDKEVFLVRAPGKLNILGRHIDHRGGRVNSIAIDKEILMVVSPRKDDSIELYNLEDRFPYRSFSIGKELEKFNWSHWEDIYPNEERDDRKNMKGDWVLYAKASALRLQERFRDRKFKGLTAFIWGDIPQGSGLSSSSALVVAFSEALCLINGLDIPPEEFIHLCGEGEWFVGTRGGMGDHAGIKMGKLFSINQFSFHPFSHIGSAPLPKGYAILFAYSYEEAHKAGKAEGTFNQRVACYEIGTRLLRKLLPKLEHLRDILPEESGLDEVKIYQLIKSLPIKMNKKEVLESLKEDGEWILTQYKCKHEEYPVRGVCLFGIAECARSKRCLELIAKGDINSLAELINISHNGDRVSVLGKDGQMVSYSNDVSDEYLDYLIENLKKHPEKKKFTLPYQTGDYACSTHNIDYMVDLVTKIEGVLGAQILGAGLGGSIMILAREKAVEKVQETLEKLYYQPRNLEPRMGVCLPIEGAGHINLL